MATALSRRQFLHCAAATLATGSFAPAASSPERKLIVVLFGGGTRSSESIDDPQHRYIPSLWNKMVPLGTLFTNMRVEGKVVHPNSAGSVVTGHWEWDDVDWARPVAHPTIFETYRKARRAPDTAAWAFVYASILNQTGYSLAEGFGAAAAANVVEPPTIPRTTAEKMDQRLHMAAAFGATDVEIEAADQCARLARRTSHVSRRGLRSPEARTFFDRQYRHWRAGEGSTSHDLFLTERAIACMRKFAPSVTLVAFGEIDCAHYGSWSRYVDAIRRTDALTARLWAEVNRLDAYRGRTLMLILPDHGRELDRSGHWGFVHHSNFYTNEGADEGCRRVWMLALGPQVRPGRIVDRPVPITTVAATGLEYLDIEPQSTPEPSVWPLMRG